MPTIEQLECKPLNPYELKIVYEIINDPLRHTTHTTYMHKRLYSKNNRCILCMMDSEITERKS